MENNSLPNGEEARLAALNDLEILDTATEKIFDFVTKLATVCCDIPISMIVLIDKNRQWFKSTYGVPEEFKDLKETPREVAFCNQTILHKDIFEVKDLTKDAHFSQNPFVTQFPNIHFYAGMPLSTDRGLNVGTLCLLDLKPRELSGMQKDTLRYLSKIVMTLMEAKRNLSEITLLGEALDTSFNEIYLFNSQNLKCIYANKSAVYRLSPVNFVQDFEFTLGEKFISFTNEEFQSLLSPLFSKQKKSLILESITLRKDGTKYLAELRIQLSDAKKAKTIIVVANNITERKKHEQALLELNKSLENKVEERTIDLENSLGLIQATLQSTTDAILVVNTDNKIIQTNQKFKELFAYFMENTDVNYVEFIMSHLASPDVFLTRLAEIINYPRQKSFDELLLKNGQVFECYSQPQLVNSIINGRVWCFRDITAQKNLQQQLMQQATHDYLTNIPNRVLLEDRIKQAIKYANENKAIFALLFIDLNRFKNINNTHGHHIGDAILKLISNRIKENLKSNDTVARLGGDEFVVLLTSVKVINEITNYTHQMLEIISKEVIIDNILLNPTASVGISVYPQDGQDAETLLGCADIAMYRSKEIFGNILSFYTKEMNIDAIKLLEIETYLTSAIKNKEITLNYEPIVDLKKNEIIAVEALIRWLHPKLGLVPPMEFIPIAETTGNILPIGEWVFRTACEQLKKWHDEGYLNLHMAINVSAHQFKQENFIDMIKLILAETKADPNFIEIELTESVMLKNISTISSKMYLLKELGITLVIDDFGTGYSSLSYLKNLPISKLKIDRSFLHSIENDPNDDAIVSAIIAMAKSLKLKVLAEGVENVHQLAILNNKNCDQIQGYLISHALNVDACSHFIKAHMQGIILA